MKKIERFAVMEKKSGAVISRHKNLDLANTKLREIDGVWHSLHSTDVPWLQGDEEALQGYTYVVAPLGNEN